MKVKKMRKLYNYVKQNSIEINKYPDKLIPVANIQIIMKESSQYMKLKGMDKYNS